MTPNAQQIPSAVVTVSTPSRPDTCLRPAFTRKIGELSVITWTGPGLGLFRRARILAPDWVWVPRTSSSSRDQAIFVDQATGASVPSDAVLLKIDRFG